MLSVAFAMLLGVLGKGDGEMPQRVESYWIKFLGIIPFAMATRVVMDPDPQPAPAAPAIPPEDEDPERILAGVMVDDARYAAQELAQVATEVAIERRLLQATHRRVELRNIRSQRADAEAVLYEVPHQAGGRERPTVRVREEPATPQPRQQRPEPAPRERAPTTQQLEDAGSGL